ncbi:short chain enoyl-CoA hydratase /3-hydroxyacyl-CoA dehydrogenase [Pseudomonas syringae]|uniref:enoyl-CoA hydratase n=2 Tax=Pseudomonas TaxID=286 RepID=A0A3M3LV01_9PSED|nr:Fatty oxidation complex, alpha subunit FadB [Pseudomonas syringae pv. apii]RMN52032.1 Fatty oxidation complex, alpha subunit FadB [Pseudomonas syringae pv. apii]RMN94990.1 Fatty oxidation complex, alpha subunit FadB [Pseudomonas syringae pv. apii]SDZ09537.1 short chain enoyl-CoA hydratase /3-hydroxyacyl-CoA dehydrogenase [Pseudomonas syringae]
MYSGITMSLFWLPEEFVEWRLDMPGPVNILNEQAIREWGEALDVLEDTTGIRGVIFTSGKNSFIAGADIKGFPSLFSGSENYVERWAAHCQELCNRIESLPFPSVAAIDRFALGGGLEFALSADYRVISHGARLALPEVTLGLCPGWGGSVRLSRLMGLDAAITYIVEGKTIDSDTAVSRCLVDLAVKPEDLLNESMALLKSRARSPQLWQGRRELKRAPIQVHSVKQKDVKATTHENAYRAPAEILHLVSTSASEPFDKALKAERELFARLAKSSDARNLVGLFIAEQALKKRNSSSVASMPKADVGGVIGAGVMGGGIAYQMAISGMKVILKDIAQPALDLGVNTINTYLSKQVKRGKITSSEAEVACANVSTTLADEPVSDCQILVEAVAERFGIKSSVLSALEKRLPAGAILSSNTSTISISDLAQTLSRPEHFCGIHFFNPVPAMPLVEVVRGEKTSDETITRAVAFAAAIGKTPIVVNDGAGFYVNRILFPYFNAFNLLLNAGVGFLRIDAVMERFGWPMGPAALADVIGLDILVHADGVLQQAFPDRMRHQVPVIAEKLLGEGFLGKKNGSGFYDYSGLLDASRKKTSIRAEVYATGSIAEHEISDQEIVDRLMIPMCLEAARCLADNTIHSAEDGNLAAVMGLGFPRFRGGPLSYIETVGVDAFVRSASLLENLGPLYEGDFILTTFMSADS